MSKHQPRLYLILILLIISSLVCNLPGRQAPEETSAPPTGGITVTAENLFTEDLAAYAQSLSTHPETSSLLNTIQARGFTTFVEGGEFEFSNGEKLHAVSLTDGSTAMVLAQLEQPTGDLDALVYEFMDDDTVFIWDHHGGLEITIQEDGQIRYAARDAEHSTAPQESIHQLAYKNASLLPQAANTCTSGMADEFAACVERFPGINVLLKTCAVAMLATIAACLAPPGVGCTSVVAGFLVGFSTSCPAISAVGYQHCFREMTDDPPTSAYSTPEETETYYYCRDGNIVVERLYQVQVDCRDDRLPAPQDLTVFLTSGEATQEYTCTDCAGQTSGGVIPHADEIEVIGCAYGCLVLSEGQARCSYFEGESPPVAPPGNNILAGTYEGMTNLGAVYVEAWGGTVTENDLSILILEDGTVAGSFVTRYDGGLSEPIAWEDGACVTQILITESGLIYGQITEPSGAIQVEITHSTEIKRSDCPSASETETVTETFDATISITGDILTGSAPDYQLTFEATKR